MVVVNHFCDRNYGITYDGLDLIFNRNVKLSSMSPGLKNMIEPKSKVNAYVAALKAKPVKSLDSRFHDMDPIKLMSGVEIFGDD